MSSASESAPPSLGVHVIGEGYGESVILQMPNGGVGVIDGFSRKLPDDEADQRLHNPTLRFLADTLRADRLSFLALTHPHEDHYRGLSHILKAYRGKIDQLWLFEGYEFHSLHEHMRVCVARGVKSTIEMLQDEDPGTSVTDYLAFVDAVFTETDIKRSPRPDVRFLTQNQPLRVEGEPVEFTVIGPASNTVNDYKKLLNRDARAAFLAPLGEWGRHALPHNLISGCLHVKFDQACLLLGGDMEALAWDEVLTSHDRGYVSHSLDCHFVKVCHHGSETGFTERAYERITRARKPVGVLTPYDRNTLPLPRPGGLTKLRGCFSGLYATHREKALAATRRVADATPGPQTTADVERLVQDPSEVESIPHQNVKAHPVSPAKFAGLLDDPDVLNAQHPSNVKRRRKSDGASEPEHQCRVSFFFGADGTNIKGRTHVGELAGPI